MTETPKYYVVEADLTSERQNILDIWQGNIGINKDLEKKYNWLYETNPGGKGVHFLLKHSDNHKPVGVAGIAKRKFFVDSKLVESGILSDMVVLKEHRTIFPAMLLQKYIKKFCEKNFHFIYGFPNKKAAPVFKRIGYKNIGNIARYAMVLRSKSYFEKNIQLKIVSSILAFFSDMGLGFRTPSLLFRNIKFLYQWDIEFDNGLGDIWNRLDKAKLVIGDHSNNYIKWRYFNLQQDNFKLFVIHNRRDKRLAGYMIFEIKNENTINVIDFLAVDIKNTLETMWKCFMFESRRRGYSSISVEFFGVAQISNILKRIGFKYRDERPVYVHLNDELKGVIENYEWYLTEGDEDQ